MDRKHSQRSENEVIQGAKRTRTNLTSAEELSRLWYIKTEPKPEVYEGPVNKDKLIDSFVQDYKKKLSEPKSPFFQRMMAFLRGTPAPQEKIAIPAMWDYLLYFMSKGSRNDFLAVEFETYQEMRAKFPKLWVNVWLSIKIGAIGLDSLVRWLCSRTGRIVASLFIGIAEQCLALKAEWLKSLSAKMEAEKTGTVEKDK